MTARSSLPDTFYVDGNLLTLPIGGDETIAQWLERVAFVLDYLYDLNGDWTMENVVTAKEASRYHLQRVLHGVVYR